MNRLPRNIVNCGLTVIALFASTNFPLFSSAQESGTNPPTASKDSGSPKPATTKNSSDPVEKNTWIPLQGDWKACQFGGDGDVTIKGGVIKMEYGDPLTGVRWEGPFDDEKSDGVKTTEKKSLPRDNYELRWECRRDKGFDFLCAFTFPIAEQHASLVMGGWGGGITGISSIDGQDASDNDTTMFKNYDDKKWYKARVRVETEKITVWIDGKEMFDQPRKNHQFDIRFEMDPCTPLGIANFECDSQIRNIQIRRLDPTEISSGKDDDQ